MKERRFYKTLIGSCVLMLCMAVVMIFTVFQADASDESKTIKYEGLDMSSYWSTTEKTAPTEEGYVFGGWYTKSGDTYTALKAADVTTGSDGKANVSDTYAKFVPKEVLDIKAQVSDTLFDDVTTNDDTAAIRFVTSLDNSMSYQKVGFNIKKGSTGTAEDAATTNYVYRTLYAVGATNGSGKAEEYKPEDLFHSESYYFKTWTITKITEKAYNTDVTVIPYWVTLDGTRVEGTKAIKTVNLGRSWVYIDTEANSTDNEEYGTRKHPFTKLDSALDAVTWVDGKITVKGTSTFEVPGGTKELNYADGFKWNQEKIKVNGSVRNITVTGENGTNSFISFDTVPDMEINDNVTFENVKLQFATKVYANGHHFKVADSVTLVNDDTTLSGGGKTASVDSTNLEIYAGSWKVIYGSSEKEAGSVEGDTHITIGGNTQIRHASTEYQNMVFGGGYSDVGGNTYVTIGGTFNSGLDLSNHDALSVVYGGGRGTGTVSKDTNVIFKDSAMATYVYGGGAAGTKVLGTCHVTMNGGNVMSVWGGGAAMDNTETEQNANTSVVVNAGTVEQIIGGNGSGMTGNTYVEVSGGTITRRIYGGCYHNETTTTAYVTGSTTVVIGKDAKFDWPLLQTDKVICAGSRFAGEQSDEVGILIFNDGTYDMYKNNISTVTDTHEYDYLVKAATDGIVSSSGSRLHVVPDKENDVYKNATVRLDNADGSLHAYMTSEGYCKLPEVNTETKNREIYVTFADEASTDQAVTNCEAKVNGTYYDTLENAVAEAKELSTEGKSAVVTLLKDVSIESALAIDGTSNITVQNEGENEFTITGSDGTAESNNIFNVSSSAKLTLTNLKLKSGHHAVYTTGTANVEMNGVSATNLNGCGIYNHGTGTVTVKNTTINEAVKYGVYVDNSKGIANLDNVKIDTISGDSSERHGIYCKNGTVNITADKEQNPKNTTENGVTILNVKKGHGIYVENGRIDANKVIINNVESGCGIYNKTGGTTSAPNKYKNVTIENVTKFGVYVCSGTVVNLENTSINTINGDNSPREGIRCEGTLNITNGVTIQTVKNSHGMRVTGSVEADKLEINDATGNGLYVSGGTVIITESFTVKNTTAQGLQFIDGATATIKGINVSNTNTTASTSVIGTSVYVTNSEENTEQNSVILIGGTISANHHGIYVDGNSQISTTDVIVERQTDNVNTLVFVGAGSTFTMNGTNAKIDGKSQEGRGVEVSGEFVLNNGTITGNKLASTSDKGAGVHVQAGGVFNMSGGSVTGNTAVNGGGVALVGTAADTEAGTEAVLATFNLTGGKIAENVATATASNTTTGAGGGIYATYASITMDGQSTEISENTGINDGAGVLLSTGATFLMNNGKITGNTLEDGLAARGGGVAIINDGSFTLEDGEVSDNIGRAGGGFILKNSAQLIINGGEIKSNKAKTINGSKGYGGAVYILDTNAQVTMNEGTIDLNTSADAGSSMYMNKGTFNWNGGTFGTQVTGSVTGSGTSNCKANVSSTITDYSIINSSKVSINVINN